jgi:hypothetical protein
MQNSLTLFKTSKISKINFKTLNHQFFFQFVKLICTTKRTAQNYYQYRNSYLNVFKTLFKLFLLNQPHLFYNAGKMDSQLLRSKNKSIEKQLLTITPKIFTEFAKNQLLTTNAINLTPNNFNKALQQSLSRLIENFLLKFKYNITGIKIICLGK